MSFQWNIKSHLGRVIRKYEGKDSALIYVVYVSDTKDDNILQTVRKAIETTGEEIGSWIV